MPGKIGCWVYGGTFLVFIKLLGTIKESLLALSMYVYLMFCLGVPICHIMHVNNWFI